MHKYVLAMFVTLVSLTIISAQFFGHGRSFGGLAGDFGGPTAFDRARDARQNRGPVVFPDPPSDAPVESSGVIVGASGYGFVPPSNGGQNKF